jgi:putative flippase GtrA/glycosyltransferase involved in cell wall biosynthesis
MSALDASSDQDELPRVGAPDPDPWAPRRRRAPGARHGARFAVFSAIGGAVFLAGLGLQALLTGRWQLPAVVSYIVQAVASVEASFLLNRWLTWRDRGAPFWPALARFNAQKIVTIGLNLGCYAVLIHLRMNYLLANVVLTAAFTVVNYIAGDRLVFTGPAAPADALSGPGVAGRLGPAGPPVGVSVVIPCRDNERTIRAAVQSLLAQDYPALREVILVGSPGDRTWPALHGVDDSRLRTVELPTPPGLRDANFKRDAGIRLTTGPLVALVDSDILLPRDWLSTAVTQLAASGTSCVAGGMRSVHDSFWGRFTDGTYIGAKTPRIAESYTVTSADFGAHGRKPPVTANALFTRALYDECPIDPSWSHGSYEDYEWFWRVAAAGHGIRVCRDLFGWHHHRRGLRALTREYRRSSRGCAYFIRAHRDSPLARRRLRQAVLLPLTAVAAAAGAAVAAAGGYSPELATLALACVAALAARQAAASRRLESLAYPMLGMAMGLVFTTGLVTNLVRPRGGPVVLPVADPPASGPPAGPRLLRRGWRILRQPITAMLVVQIGLSASLVRSNTAFGDEANYLSLGHELIAYMLHGTVWPSAYAHSTLSGSPFIYPPIGAVADSVGGLAGARILSLIFLLGATILLYSAATRLFGKGPALFGTALWVVHSPTIQLGAFATYDALSVSLTALAGWVIVQIPGRRFRGEWVTVAAVALALANATAYSGVVVDPMVVAFALFVWLPGMGGKQAISCTAWFTAATGTAFASIMTITKCWPGIANTIFARVITGAAYASPLHVFQDTWTYTGLIIVLAVIGAVIAFTDENRRIALLVAVLAAAAFVVPFAQAHETTAVSLKKHLAYGAWFAAMAAGYASHKIAARIWTKRSALVACSVLAFTYPAVNGWWAAYEWYQSWDNASSMMAAVRPIADRTPGYVYLPQQGNAGYLCKYALFTSGSTWRRCVQGLPNPANLAASNAGVIVLAFSTSVSPPSGLPGGIFLRSRNARAREQLLSFIGKAMNAPRLAAVTVAVEDDPHYRLVTEGPYNSGKSAAIYAIWVRT